MIRVADTRAEVASRRLAGDGNAPVGPAAGAGAGAESELEAEPEPEPDELPEPPPPPPPDDELHARSPTHTSQPENRKPFMKHLPAREVTRRAI